VKYVQLKSSLTTVVFFTRSNMVERIAIPLNDPKRQYLELASEINNAIERVLKSGWYILGPEVEAFEREFADYCGTNHCIAVANGTEALEIALKALGILVGDEVITVANAGMYSTTAIRAVGALPVFADIEPLTMTMDPNALAGAITPRTRAVIITHLYGRMAQIDELVACAKKYNLAIIEDCAQAHGAHLNQKCAGSFGDVGCYSFYPTKNLGALGDGGGIVTSDPQIAGHCKRLRQYGWNTKYYARELGGMNSRLDELQAAILRVKLPHLDRWNEEREAIKDRYFSGINQNSIQLPTESPLGEMVWHLFVVRAQDRDHLLCNLQRMGVRCAVHYPMPDHLQRSCVDLGYKPGALPETELAAREVLSLPIFPGLTQIEINQVIDGVLASVS
jgi:aminotransferase EvaB